VVRTARANARHAAEPFVAAYPRLWQGLRALEWSAYNSGHPVDRSGLDRDIFNAAAGPSSSPELHPDGLLVERLRRRALVDHHPVVARLRDRLDDGAAYASGTEPSSPTGRRELAAAMESDLVTLIRLRDSMARDLGAASYGHLAMDTEGLDLDAVMASMSDTREAGLEEAAALASEAGLTIATWLDGLDALAGPTPVDTVTAARELATRLGCEDLLASVRLQVVDGPLAGWAAAVSIPDDIRLLVRPARSLRDLATVFHEVGHALAYAGTRATGIRAIPGDTQDEAMGSLLEEVGARLLLTAAERGRLESVAAAERTRLATSALFEAAIQVDPTSVRQQFLGWYSPLVKVTDPVEWALDTFRSVDPFRVHAYVLGHSFARQVIERLAERFGEDHLAWGTWLRERLWAPGRRDTFEELATP
jgi:hypothetical protein